MAYRQVSNRESRYRLTQEANAQRLVEMVEGNGVAKRELRGVMAGTQENLDYWQFAKEVMLAVKAGRITENVLNGLNAQADQQLRENNNINIKKLEKWVKEQSS